MFGGRALGWMAGTLMDAGRAPGKHTLPDPVGRILPGAALHPRPPPKVSPSLPGFKREPPFASCILRGVVQNPVMTGRHRPRAATRRGCAGGTRKRWRWLCDRSR